jgi:hypothetical protein
MPKIVKSLIQFIFMQFDTSKGLGFVRGGEKGSNVTTKSAAGSKFGYARYLWDLCEIEI